jgi:trans-aconitate 2-methyltransferase
VSAPDPTRSMNSGAREWDAETYDAVSDPQFSWGMEVLERLELSGDEVALDAGCGSGRVTAELAKRLPRGRLIAVDGSEAMIAKARERLGEGPTYVVSDLSQLELAEPVDLIFSTATFHWILDHDRLFSRLRAVLRPGGRLVAQCGGEGNVAEHAAVIAKVAAQPEFAAHLEQMTGIWNFAAPEETERRLHLAGFAEARCWLQPKPVQPERPLEFTSTVTLGPLLAQLPEELRRPFAEAILEQSEQPLVLDYIRLNIEAVAGRTADSTAAANP